jgi:toxin ParE1/3/4
VEIVWLRRAAADLQSIEEYIGNDNPIAADIVAERILNAVAILSEQPSAGRRGRVHQTRELVVSSTPYIVVYTALSDRIFILAVMHGAREWPQSF